MQRVSLLGVLAATLAGASGAPKRAAVAENGPTDSAIFDLAMVMANATIAQLPDFLEYPSNSACQGCPAWATSTYGGWTSGFFSGTLLALYNYSVTNGIDGAGWWLSQALARNDGLARNANNTGTHDVGFMVYTSLGHEYLLTGNETARRIVLQTAHSLSERFYPKIGAIESWGTVPEPANDDFEVIVDNMMNLELLFWAGTQGNATLTDIAISHADVTLRDIFQPFNPGCVWHLLQYNWTSGALRNRTSTPQGLGVDTVWSRGQAWATNGYAIAYRYTQLPRFLAAAQSAADCFLRLLEVCATDHVPCWDFNISASNYAVDSSAAAIFASGAIEIAGFTADPALKSKYLAGE